MRRLRRLARRILNAARDSAERLGSRSAFGSALYYLLFNRAFRFEQQIVLKGKVGYKDQAQQPRVSSYLVRRNVHRIEKGLIMRPRREAFATSYIVKTVNAFKRILDDRSVVDEKEIGWAFGVLSAYFAAASGHSEIERARQLWEEVLEEELSDLPAPYPAASVGKSPVAIAALRQLSIQRRSIRWYDGRPVPREAIDAAIEIASDSPSACNRQAFEYLVLDNPELIRRVGPIAPGTKGFHENFPCLVVVLGDLSAYFDERDRHVIYIDASLATMAFMYALTAQGLASCSINWPDIREKEDELRSVLSIPDHKRPVMMVSVGYASPDGLVPSSVKKPLSVMRSFNTDRYAPTHD